MKHRSHCPIVFALDLFGDRWSLIILRDLILFGKKYYKDLLESSEKISTNILAQRLKFLEDQAFLVKTNDPDNLKRFIYLPSSKALDLIPILIEMVLWSVKYDPETGARGDKLKAIQGNPKAFEKKIRSQFL